MEMSSKTQKNPSIRFKGFTDAWEQRKLGDDKDVRDGTHDSPKYHQEGHPLVTSKNLNDYGLDMTDVSLISDADFEAINKRSKVDNGDILFGMIGTIGNPVIVDRSDFAIKNVALIKEGGDIPNRFLIQLLKSSVFEKYIRNENAGNTQKFLGLSKIREFTFFTPTIEEQSRIATFFKQLDDTIALHQRQQDNYKQLKKYMLQKIFNQEFRFKDKNGNDYPDWEEIALKELGETFTGLSGKTKENFGKGKGKFVTYMNVFSNSTANLAMTENVEIKDGEKQNEVRYGDIFFTTSSETPDEVGMSSVWLSHESNVYLNSFCFGYRLNSESESKVISQFLGAQLRAEHIRKEIVLLAQGSTRFNISKAKLIEIPLYLPVIQEQQKIADFLSMLDVRIEQLSQKVELLKEQKKGLMQKMFV